ncbi:efflux RND transporter permease subunit [Heliophilum fasciatum]|uniref:AcrB/AcrD/AcrF family protein n=1 Tax=Heliophilum fasciatum TaxID=35700 RepID=A0A4R2RM54_9FIRM|nr:efflux RND transporter permease subunit [Heliophilum fasciatum]MCW2278985.1 multidrug efflux pump subunit AcrB [Heliophilum fasciatum]TCP64064.1 AcrB/AcrD/AcrF family protein [Heliophilum fasciatum]
MSTPQDHQVVSTLSGGSANSLGASVDNLEASANNPEALRPVQATTRYDDPGDPSHDANHINYSTRTIGFSGKIAAFFLRSKLTPIIVVASLLLGLFAVLTTPREEEPQIVVPMIDVHVAYPTAGAAEVEERVTKPLEQKLYEIKGVEYVYSTSMPGRALVTARFQVGFKSEDAMVQLYNKVMSNMDLMPPGVSQPLVKPKSVDDVSILNLTLWSKTHSDYDLRRVAAVLEDEIRTVPNVSDVQLYGASPRQLRVLVRPEHLAAYKLSLGQLSQILQSANFAADAGPLQQNNYEYMLRAGRVFTTASDVGNLVISTQSGLPVFLRDIATITDGPGDVDNYVLMGQKDGIYPAVTIAVAKQKGTNASTIAEAALKKVEDLKGKVITGDMEMTVTRNYGETASEKATELIEHLLLATASVVLLIGVFLGLRESLVIGVAVPVTLAIALAISQSFGYTLNRVTLFALIFAIGILVDDAIVVVENIHRWFAMRSKFPGLSPADAAIRAVDEVGNPTILATLTVIAVLMPMAFVGGMMGPYMSPIPINASVAMFFSLLVAFIVTPWFAYRFLKHEDKQGHGGPTQSEHDHGESTHGELSHTVSHNSNAFLNVAQPETASLNPQKTPNGNMTPLHEPGTTSPVVTSVSTAHPPENTTTHHPEKHTSGPAGLYTRVMEKLLYRPSVRWGFFAGVAVLLIASMALVYTKDVGMKMLPFDNKSELQIIIDTPEGTTLENTLQAAQAIGAYLGTVNEVTNYQIYAGTGAPFNFNGLVRHYYLRQGGNVADIQVNFIGKKDRQAQSHDIAKRIRPEVHRIAQAFNANAKLVEIPPGPPVMAPLLAEVYGPTPESQRAVAAKVKAIFEQTPGVVDVDWNVEDDQKELTYKVKDKAHLHGISEADITGTLQTAVSGTTVGLLRSTTDLEPVPIILRYPLPQRSLTALQEIRLPSASGAMVPLSELVTVEEKTREKSLHRKNLQPVTYVMADVAGKIEGPVYSMIDMWDAIGQIENEKGQPLEQNLTAQPWLTHVSSLKWDGEWQITYEVFRDLGAAFLIGLVVMYLLIVGWFQSFSVPALIMSPIPLTLIGIIPGHWLLGSFFTATSFIGAIALAGIIVRNSILLVEFAHQRTKEGVDPGPAVVEAGIVRAQPIVLTAAAVVVGAFVILFDPIFQGLAISLIFGTIASTFLTLFIIPMLYYLMMRKKSA